ncbi:hypothetical protein [uncultured Clostridium sp.]|jgi:hypothetical protein|uniref:hypothetical protein n=1 Tax=uncultured Clostridium sp. TaxID=59620 RepID=UPI00260875B5|nr:hypothetical protein [uncultured Clostridium sp.]
MNITINKKAICLRLAIAATIFYLIITLALNKITTPFLTSLIFDSGLYFGFFYVGMLLVFNPNKIKKQFLKDYPIELLIEDSEVSCVKIFNNEDSIQLVKKSSMQMLSIILIGTIVILVVSGAYRSNFQQIVKMAILFGALIIIAAINYAKAHSKDITKLGKINKNGFLIYSYSKTEYIPWEALSQIKEFQVDGSFIFSFYINKKYLNVSNPLKMLKIKNTEDYGIGLLTFATTDPNKEFLLKDFLYLKTK